MSNRKDNIMTFTTFKSNREMDINELREVLLLMENQETTDVGKSTSIYIDGEYATIKVDIDELGNVTLV